MTTVSRADFTPSLDLGSNRVAVDPETRRIAVRIANWDDVHSGFGSKVRMPRNVNVEAAHVGQAMLDDGSSLRVATLPMDTMHAPRNLDAMHAASWYENTGKAIARVRYSTDELGLRADGVLFDDVTGEQLDRITAAAPSGDWRSAIAVRKPTDFEHTPADLVGACIVNIPGFSDTYAQSEGQKYALAASANSIITFEEDVMDVLTAASGSLPIADRSRPWDSGAAIQRIKSWATTDGEIDFAKYGRAFLYHDRSMGERQGAYKLPYADVIDGTLTAVPRGAFAAAAAIEGSRGGVDLPADAVAGVKAHLGNLYKQMAAKFNDKSIKVPWGSKMTAAAHDGEDVKPECDETCDTCTCGKKDSAMTASADHTEVDVKPLSELESLRASAAAEVERIDALIAAGDYAMTPTDMKSHQMAMAALEERLANLEQLVADALLSM